MATQHSGNEAEEQSGLAECCCCAAGVVTIYKWPARRCSCLLVKQRGSVGICTGGWVGGSSQMSLAVVTSQGSSNKCGERGDIDARGGGMGRPSPLSLDSTAWVDCYIPIRSASESGNTTAHETPANGNTAYRPYTNIKSATASRDAAISLALLWRVSTLIPSHPAASLSLYHPSAATRTLRCVICSHHDPLASSLLALMVVLLASQQV